MTTLSAEELISLLEQNSRLAIDWINENNIGKASKFQALSKQNQQDTSRLKLEIYGEVIETSKRYFFSPSIDNKLPLSVHISEVCRKAGNTLNGKKRRKYYLKRTYYYSKYCQLVWHFCGKCDLHLEWIFPT